MCKRRGNEADINNELVEIYEDFSIRVLCTKDVLTFIHSRDN